jgi:ABC-type phosphate transport system substrate-binding protein
MKKLLTLIVFYSLMQSTSAIADIAVIVNPSNANSLDGSTISRIFLGKAKSFPDGSNAEPINSQEGAPSSNEFNQKVLKKSASQLKAYWSKLVFTGKGTPPKAVGGDEDVLKLVSSNSNAIGYIDASKVDGSVKVVATF